jgi:hypothetical protein
MDFILNYPNRCIIGVKNLMTIVWEIRIYYYLRCNISMLRLICDHWFLMLDKCGVYVRVSREVSITAEITEMKWVICDISASYPYFFIIVVSFGRATYSSGASHSSFFAVAHICLCYLLIG